MRLYKVEAYFGKHVWKEWFVLALTEDFALQAVDAYTKDATSVSVWEESSGILTGTGSIFS